jgi:hypothetical protein
MTKFPPRDDSKSDSELNSFINELKQVIKTKDEKKLISMIHPDIKFDFDDGIGISKFKMSWTPEDKNSELWTVLDKIVGLGGVFSKNTGSPFYEFVFPYVNQVKLDNPDDFFHVLVVTGKNVNVREQPSVKSKVLGQLTYDIVRYDYQKSYPLTEKSKIEHLSFYGPKEWYYIETDDKKLSGFIYWDFVWSPIDYRMFLTKEKGTWMISCLIEGD